MGSGTPGVASDRRHIVTADKSNLLLLYLMLTRPIRDVPVAASQCTLEHNQQDLAKLNGTQTRQTEHIS